MYIPAALFSTDFFWSCVKWLMILLIWGIFAWGTWRENRRIKVLLSDKVSDLDAVTLLRTLHRRDLQIWLQVSLLLVVVAANDIHHGMEQLPIDFFSVPVAAPPAPLVKETPDAAYDSALKKNSAPDMPFSNITEFNEKNGKQEAYIDLLKERYESWLVSYYYLQKCKQTDAQDYDLIHRLLQKDLTAAHSDAAVEGNILMAASGSYKEMYSDIPCDSAHLAATKAAYDVNMQQVREVRPKAASATAISPTSVPKSGNTTR